MSKIRFKCKGKLLNGDPCDMYVSTKMHKGISTFIRIQELTKEIKSFELKSIDFGQQKSELTQLKEIPHIPKDWEFTLRCSNNHEYDYSYDECEK